MPGARPIWCHSIPQFAHKRGAGGVAAGGGTVVVGVSADSESSVCSDAVTPGEARPAVARSVVPGGRDKLYAREADAGCKRMGAC